ncbi:MAG: DNA/RNA non-specific endonuclease [Selenomonadaceae bacterium]|nr:DNA/RNA non-specific endonuclease [Selenomonadaceae bacterium]
MNITKIILCIAMSLTLLLSGCGGKTAGGDGSQNAKEAVEQTLSAKESKTAANAKASNAAGVPKSAELLATIPPFSGKPYVTVNNNKPYFTKSEITREAFEKYSELDKLGRPGVAFACIGVEIMPTEKRGKIGQIKPPGWHTARYDDLIKDKYLYNHCHLIAFMLAGENANEKNLITGTRYFNTEAMLPFEQEVFNYVKNSKNHAMYRVTPVYDGDNLVASGVLMEAKSVENDKLEFCVYCYNVQPGVGIDYKTGESWRE